MSEEYEELRDVSEIETPDYSEEDKEPKTSIFDIINDISNHGNYIESFLDNNKRMPNEYSIYMINKAFGNFTDTIFIANEMNKFPSITEEFHWRFFHNTITKRKRFSKWFKNIEDEEPIVLLAKYFDCTVNEMRKNIHVLSEETKYEILRKMDPEKYDKEICKSRRKRT